MKGPASQPATHRVKTQTSWEAATYPTYLKVNVQQNNSHRNTKEKNARWNERYEECESGCDTQVFFTIVAQSRRDWKSYTTRS